MSEKNACYGCQERHPGCHGKCEKYAAFLEEKDRKYHQRVKANDGFVYSAYVRRKKAAFMDDAAKRRFRMNNYQKGRYR